jgi:outer membrane protein assembly factor BamB
MRGLLFIIFLFILQSCNQSKELKKAVVKKKNVVALLPDTSDKSVLENLTYEIKLVDSSGPALGAISTKYLPEKGVLGFRGSLNRDMVSEGRLTKRPAEVKMDWEFTTAYDGTKTKFGVWGGGNGWTGQPLIINWDYKGIPATALASKPNAKKEVIISSLCGKIYFLNFENGEQIRPSLDTHNPIKGTAMFDPDYSGNLFVGQGINETGEFGFRVFDMFKGKLDAFVSSTDRDALRGWGAFDSSPIKVGNYYFWPGENGVLYKFRMLNGEYKLHSKLVYHSKKPSRSTLGIESSLSVYKNYGYFGDNQGNVVCVNLATLKPVWYFDNIDDSDATIVIEEEKGIPYLYIGCEVDKQGELGFSFLRKLNALTGKEVWLNKIPAQSIVFKEKTFNGGMLSTPLLGKHQAKDLLYVCISQPSKSSAGQLMSIDKQTGKVKFSTKLNAYSWSSPVGFYTNKGEPFVLIGDVVGNIYLIDGLSGEKIFAKNLGGNFEASPAVMDDQLIIGSRGNKIYKFKII